MLHPELWIAANISDLGGAVTLMHLGRGGVQKDGTLDRYNQCRVEEVIRIARRLSDRFSDLDVEVIFTGKCNRAQHLSGVKLPATEAGAALTHAKSLHKSGDKFTVATEDESTSTVENAIFTARAFSIRGPLVVMTDPLHFRGGKVESIMKKVFPLRSLMFVELPDRLDNARKEVRNQLISAIATRIGMAFVSRGDLVAIERRQRWLEKFLERIFRP